MSFADDSFDDDDDDFLALTMKPKNTISKATQLTQTQAPDSNHQRLPTTQGPQTDLLAAKGEIAVLRAKIDELERQRQHEREILVREKVNEKTEKESKVSALEDLVRRLEDEKKFLSVEVRNLNARKRQKRLSEDHSRREEEMISDSTTPEPVTPMPKPSAPPSSNAAIPRRPDPPVKINAPKQTNDNAQIIDCIMNHTIPGSQRSTMDYLSKISLDAPFTFEKTTIPQNEPIATHLLQFLVKQREPYRLDEFITKFAKLLTLLIKDRFVSERKAHRFPIPYLMALLHSTIMFRPRAVTKEVLRQLVGLCHDLMNELDSLLKPDEDVGEWFLRHKRVGITAIQYEFTDHMTLVFSCDLLETLMITASDDSELLKSVLTEINENDEFQSFIRLAFGTSSNLLVMFPILEVMSCCLNAFDGKDTYPLISREVVSALVHILLEGKEWSQNWLFNGLIRMAGNTIDNAHVAALVGDKLKSYPAIIHPVDIREKAKVDNLHEQQLLTFQLNILSFFEKLIITTTNGITLLNTNPETLKSLVFAIGKQQELVFQSPRNNLTHRRSELISSMIRILHLIWEMTTMDTGFESPALTKDTTRELMIVLARIAFSSNETSSEAHELLLETRKKDRKTPVFNIWAESRALQVSHANETTDVEQFAQAQMGYSNGLEFAYDDDARSLAKEMLEKCTTMDEADTVYEAMMFVDERRQDDDVLMMEAEEA